MASDLGLQSFFTLGQQDWGLFREETFSYPT